MKKIIIAFDGKNFSRAGLKYAALLNQQDKILLTGVFAPNTSFAGSYVYPTEVPVAGGYPVADEDVIESMEKNIDEFERYCQRSDIEYRVHRDTGDFALPQLKYESRFADLLVLSSASFFSVPKEERISALFKEVLHAAECPVLIVPEDFVPPEHIVLAYDGSEDAVFAIKQFCYLLPEFTVKQCLLVYANPNPKSDVPDLYNIEELAGRHFADLTIEKVDLMPQRYFATWLAARRSPLLVTGSFGRNTVSRMFRKSFITDVIEYSGTLIFVAHR